MKRLKFVISVLALFLICKTGLHAQPFPLSISIQVNPPYSADYTSYFSGPNQVLMTIVNNSAITQSIYLAGSISTIDGSIVVQTSPSSPWPGAALIVPPGLHAYNGTDLQPFAENSNVEYTGITQQDILSGLLPEGDYQICLRAFDFNTLAPLSEGEPSGCSNIFTIAYPPPPQIIQPECGESITAVTPQNLLFSWQQPTGVPPSAILRYRFTLVLLPDGIDAISALENPIDPVYSAELPSVSLLYSMSQPSLIAGRRYAWRVQAIDLLGAIAFQNNGYSEPCTFTYLREGSSGGPVSMVYPTDRDTLPWTYMPFISRFDPYSNDYVGHNRTFTLRENGAQVDIFNRDLNWPLGPEQSQEQALGGMNITQEESQHINLYKRIDNVPAPVQFRHGNRYEYAADVQIENASGADVVASLEGEFVSGMGRPSPLFPPNRDSVLKDEPLELRFWTADAPTMLVPSMSIMQTSRSASGPAFFNGGINERWKLEISRREDFSSVVSTASARVGAGLDYLSGACNESCLIDSLYKEVLHNYTPTDTGWYYWKICWLQDATSAAAPPYLCSSVYRFYVADSLSTPTDTVPPTPGECVNTCLGPVIPADQRVAVSTATAGSTVSIGMFEMRITEITWSGSSATGRGTIPVPFMHAPLKVRFSGLRINASNRVFDGDVTGEYDNATIIPGGISDGIARITSIDEGQATALNAFVNSAGRLVSQFTMDNPVGLPIGIDQEIDDKRVTIGIVGLRFTPETATLNAMVSLDFAELNGWLSLGATNVCFHPDGIGGDGKGMLYLPLDKTIPFGDSITLRFDKTEFNADYTAVTDSGTYVSWDCQGFKALNVDGAVVFGRDVLVEDLESGEPGPAQIEAQFSCRIRRHGQWMARLNFNHPFQIAGAPGWGFAVEEAWLDFADGQNPDGFSFPNGYQFDTTLFAGGADLESIDSPELYWKGFYLKRQVIRMPRQFESYSNPAGRLTGSVNNMLIDRRGLTASFRVENIVNVSDGNLAGWGFSIDTLMIDVVMNSFSRGGFVGEIRIPASDSLLEYSSMLRQNITTRNFSYEFRINPKDTINADLWAAELALAPTSYISATIDSAGVFARAELTGHITIDTELDGVGRINFRFMEFEELGFQTRAPYIDCDENCIRFAFASPQKFLGGSSDATSEGGSSNNGGLSGFPVSIENIGLTFRDGGSGPRAGVVFTLALNLTGESNTFSAATTLAILGRLNLGGSSGQTWEFDGVELDSIGISGSVGVVTLSGGLRFYNGDVTYGNGFKGFIQATFKPTISARVSAQFGEKQGNRYWYVDAQVVFNPGITLMAGLDVYGFGGGAYYHMRRTTPLPSAAGMTTSDTTGRGAPGMTLSGVNFVPDFTTGFGFSATVIFGNTGGGDAYNADVTFGAEFSESGGISLMYLRGNAYFMCDKTDRSNPQVHAMADISYDFVRQIFDARFEVTVNIAGGLVAGVNPGGRAGMIHIYASPETWFIHVGNPETPIGLNFLNMFQTRSYLMIGMNLPSAPPPPPEVTSIITPATLYRHPGLSSGDGFAFGSRMDFNTGRLGFLLFYARLAMGMGFDISLMNYGPDVFCEGAPPGTTIGVDGWYANGQIYAYIMGEIGIYVDLWVVSGEFKILEMGAAALLQGGLPNPSWLQGTCGGYYSILNGMVRGNCQFEFKVGDECRPAPESPLANVEILSDLIPYNGEQNVDCGTNPEASFNAEVNQEFDLEEVRANGSIVPRRFRFVMESFELRKGGALVQTERQVAQDHFKAMLIPSSFLDPYTEYVVSIRIRGEEYNFQTGTWGPAQKRDGSPITAQKTNTFKTGAYPDRIPDNNVLVSYPFNTQRFYLQGECNRGFVKLKQWMAPLFNSQPNLATRRSFKVRFIPIDGGQEVESELEFYESAKQLSFEIPGLMNNKVYACQVISKDTSIILSSSITNLANPSQFLLAGGTSSSSNNSANQNLNITGLSLGLTTPLLLQTSTLQQLYTNQAGGMTVRSNRINGRTVRKNEKLLYVFFFKTSQHNTLEEKMAAINASSTNRAAFGLLEWLEPSFTGGEKFDVFDVNGFRFVNGLTPQFIQPLVSMTEARTDSWNQNWTNPVIYNLYNNLRSSGYTTLRFNRANPDTLGIPPQRTVRFHVDNPTRNPLAPTEFLPLSTAPNSIFNNLAIQFANQFSNNNFIAGGFGFSTAAPSTMKLNVETGFRTWVDYTRLVTIGNNIQMYYGSPYTSEFYSDPLKSQFIRFIESRFQPMYRGNYQAKFFFNQPYFMCTDPDFYPPGIPKNYTY